MILLALLLLAPASARAAPVLYAATYGSSSGVGGGTLSGLRTVASDGTVGTPTVTGSSSYSSSGLVFDSSGNLYASNNTAAASASGSIIKFDAAGVGSLYASGLNFSRQISFGYIVYPEPASLSLLALGSLALVRRRNG